MVLIHTTMVYLFAYILWCVWASYQGKEEAYQIVAKRYVKLPTFKVNLHKFWTLQRIIVATGIFTFFLLDLDTIEWYIVIGRITALAVSFILCFSFFHNGFLYMKWNTLEGEKIWPKGFFDSKPESEKQTATFEISFKFRTAMLIFSLLILTTMIIYRNNGF